MSHRPDFTNKVLFVGSNGKEGSDQSFTMEFSKLEVDQIEPCGAHHDDNVYKIVTTKVNADPCRHYANNVPSSTNRF